MTPEGVDDETLVFFSTQHLRVGLKPNVPAQRRVRHAGLAVSGGGDSMAMLHLVAPWAVENGIPVSVATVDHGLRPEASAEAAFVAGECAALGLDHAVLRWTGWDGRGNLQAAARMARRRLLAEWANERGCDAVLLGHTRDDVAETVLLRLARGSGVDGLAWMANDWRDGGIRWLRVLTDVTREDLRGYLRRHSHAWVEDPSNADLRFDRVRARAMMDSLATLGLTRERLLRTAAHMAAAQRTLRLEARRVAAEMIRQDGSDLLLSRALLERRLGVEDTPGRLLTAALQWVGGREHRPRFDALLRVGTLLRAGRTATLAGCLIVSEGDWVRISREARTVGTPPTKTFAEFLASA